MRLFQATSLAPIVQITPMRVRNGVNLALLKPRATSYLALSSPDLATSHHPYKGLATLFGYFEVLSNEY